MSDHHANVVWERAGATFLRQQYSRVHAWQFDGGVELRASASPAVVRPPFADPTAVDPEEAFLAAIASCHMLFFLSFASKAGLVVERYEDEPHGTVLPFGPSSAALRETLGKITLRPRVTFASEPPSREKLDELHHAAHEACFLANALREEILVEPRDADAAG